MRPSPLHLRRDALLVLWLLSSLPLAGCGGGGDELPREEIIGSVALDGTPLASGTITFMPEDPGSTGTQAGAAIAGGAFKVRREEGPVPGTYRVSISSTEEVAPKAGKGPALPGDGDAPLIRERIPARYNSQTTLKATVEKGGKNVFDFSISSK